MPLSLFDHSQFAHYRSKDGIAGEFDHSFGGDPKSYGLRFVNAEEPFHLIYRLDLRDPSIPIRLDSVSYLPLVYGFHYAAYNGEFIYRVINDLEIEILAPAKLEHDANFPYDGHPATFPFQPTSFERILYDRSKAEDALSLQGIFGLDGLSAIEMKRAITIARQDSSYVSYSRDKTDPDWTEEDILRSYGEAPFMQGAPLKSCTNPECTAEIAYHVDDEEYEMSAEFFELTGETTLKTPAHDVRVDSMRVIAIHQPAEDDELMWGDPFNQMVFEFCDCCHCIRVSSQCT